MHFLFARWTYLTSCHILAHCYIEAAALTHRKALLPPYGFSPSTRCPRCKITGTCIRVRSHFRFEAKWSETEAKFFSLQCEKSFFCACFVLKWNVEIWSETKMKQSKSKTKKKQKLPSFSLWSEMKLNGSEIIFALTRKKCFFACFCIWSEAKIK